jgi:hypothetical protein
MMTDDVDELLRQAAGKFDQAIIELAIEEGCKRRRKNPSRVAAG